MKENVSRHAEGSEASHCHAGRSEASGSHCDRPVFISAAEPSADRHGAALIKAAQRLNPQLRFIGVAGPQMVEAGCESVFDMTSHSAMLLAALGNVARGIRMLNVAEEHLRRRAFAAAVVIDSPTLHLPLAGRARTTGVPVMYYIAPQMWAWGAHRIYKLRHRVDKLAVILPFEEKYFRDQGVDATFVGHPLAEQVANERIDQASVARLRSEGAPLVALLPGSRKHVVAAVLPGQLEVAEAIQKEFPRAAFEVSIANRQTEALVESGIRATSARMRPYRGRLTELIEAADFVLVASGTTALEVAFHGKPMIVMYQSSRFFYHAIARWMIHTPFLSLPNILAGRAIVPEFMPYYTSTEPIAQCAIDLLKNESARERMQSELRAMAAPLVGASASQNAAKLLCELIGNLS